MPRLECRPFRLKLARPYVSARGTFDQREGVLVRAVIGGAVGWGDILPQMSPRMEMRTLLRQIAQLAEAIDPADPDAIGRIDARNPSPVVRAGFVNAILSARALLAGVPLAVWMAGTARTVAATVPVYAQIRDAAPEAAAARAHTCVEAGFRALRISCGGDRAANLARVAAVRAAARGAALHLDANGTWREDWALAHLRDLAAFRIAHVEQPLAPDQPDAVLARLAAASPIPLAIGPAGDLDALDRLLGAGAGRVVILEQSRLGGVDRVQKAIGLAVAHGCRAVVTAGLESAVGRAASAHAAALIPPPVPACGLLLQDFYAGDTAPDLPLRAGRLSLPSNPGLGVDPADFWASLPLGSSEALE